MHFLPDVYVTCDVCKGKRYNRETLDVTFKSKTIADVLDMTVEEALDFFKAVPRVRNVLELLHRVGLDYIHVGQQATTLSGGEAQRVKLAKELSKRATGRTFYILDEPTTGLHFHDVAKLLEVLHELVEHRQHRGRDRAQSRSDQDRRLDHRPRPRRRRRRRRDRRRGHARGRRQGEAQLHRRSSSSRCWRGARTGGSGGRKRRNRQKPIVSPNTNELKYGLMAIRPGQPIYISANEDAPPSSSDHDTEYRTRVGQTLKAYLIAVKSLLDGKLKHLRDIAPIHMTSACRPIAFIFPEGIIVRYDRQENQDWTVLPESQWKFRGKTARRSSYLYQPQLPLFPRIFFTALQTQRTTIRVLILQL